MSSIALTFVVAALSTTASSRVINRSASDSDGEGEARIAAQALMDGIQSNGGLQSDEEASLTRIKGVINRDQVDMLASAAAKKRLGDLVNTAIADLDMARQAQAEEPAQVVGLADNDLAIIDKLQQDFAGGGQQNVQEAIHKRQADGENNNYSNNATAPDPHQTGWIFGAIIISLALVLLGILILRKKRKENLQRTETHEMKLWEDALT